MDKHREHVVVTEGGSNVPENVLKEEAPRLAEELLEVEDHRLDDQPRPEPPLTVLHLPDTKIPELTPPH